MSCFCHKIQVKKELQTLSNVSCTCDVDSWGLSVAMNQAFERLQPRWLQENPGPLGSSSGHPSGSSLVLLALLLIQAFLLALPCAHHHSTPHPWEIRFALKGSRDQRDHRSLRRGNLTLERAICQFQQPRSFLKKTCGNFKSPVAFWRANVLLPTRWVSRKGFRAAVVIVRGG